MRGMTDSGRLNDAVHPPRVLHSLGTEALTGTINGGSDTLCMHGIRRAPRGI